MATKKRNKAEPEPAILWIGGPEGVKLRDVTRIGADFGSVMHGPWPDDYGDFDIVVFWPNRDTFLLPGSRDEWEHFRTGRGHPPCLPAIDPGYWAFRPTSGRRCLELPDADSLIASSSVAPTLPRTEYARDMAEYCPLEYRAPLLTESCKSESDALLLERLLWWRCAMRLRTAVLAMAQGAVLIVILPAVEFDAAWCCGWLTPWIGEHSGPGFRPRGRSGRTSSRQKLAAGSLEAITRMFAQSGSARAGRLCLESVDPSVDQPVPLSGRYELGSLLLHAMDFTIRGSPEDLRANNPGWGVPANITTWPLKGAPHAIIVSCLSGGAVVVPADQTPTGIVPALHRWYRERRDPAAPGEEQRLSKNIFRLDIRRNVWVIKIANEAPVELPGELRGCHYYRELLRPENRDRGVDSAFLHYMIEMPEISRGERKTPESVQASQRLKRHLQEIEEELKTFSEAPIFPNLDTQDFGKQIDEVADNSSDPRWRELDNEKSKILEALLELMRRGKSKEEHKARTSVRGALDRVCDKIEEQQGKKLYKHLSVSYHEEACHFIYTGGLDWELD